VIDADQLRRDLSPFCDPATELNLVQGTAGIRIELVRNGTDHDYFYDLANGTLVARHLRGRKIVSLRSLLASSEFADLRSFVHTQNRVFKDFDLDGLIPPDGEIQSQRLTSQLLYRALSPQKTGESSKKIGIVLIDGPAGVGKTSLIQSFLIQRARRQKDANSLPPILHVTSRGRRLAGLDDALAQAIDLVRARFTFDQAPVLVRYNLLQIAIDGFDELVDPEGYADAWYALRDFFTDVGVGGPVILAGRDTFFDQQNFVKQLQAASIASDVTHIRLSTVSPAKAREWLRQQGWSDEDTRSQMSRIVFRAGSYALRPFFLRQLAEAKGWKAITTADLTPRAFLVDKFVKREAGLLSEQLSIPGDQVRERLSGLFEEIASEMADNESDVVDLGFLQLVTEVAFGDLLNIADLAKLKHKAGSFALLETDQREGYRRFPHTEISNHFLASFLIKAIASGIYTRFLRRGLLTADMLNIFGEILLKKSETRIVALVESLTKVLAEELSFDRLGGNAAALLVTSLSCPYPRRLRHIRDLSLLNAVLFGAIEPAHLQHLQIQRLDVKEADLTQVEFNECEVVNLTADETTLLGRSRPDIHHLLIETQDGTVTEISEPSKIAGWLSAHSQHDLPTTENSEAIRLLDKVCRVMLRQHMIKEHQEDRAGRLLQLSYWSPIEAILMRTKWLERIDGKAVSGARASFVRMRDPYKLLVDRTDSKVKIVWAQVAALPVQ
jgi:hypothetical protein